MDLRQNIFKAHNLKLPPLENAAQDKGLSPLSWTDYFETQRTVSVSDTQFNVYASGLSNSGPIFLLHHGAGHSGLTFGLASKHIFNSDPSNFTVVAPDFRDHGATFGENQGNLSLEQMVDDVINLFAALFPDNSRDVVIVGHSMGGAVAAHTAASKRIRRVVGLVLIDIVEGSAMDSLSAIPVFINARPKSFASLENAIAWHIESDAIQNVESARLSVPSLLVSHDKSNSWTWRTQLLPTERFWKSWYSGLSKTFTSAPTAKLLILAGTDRLDKDLLIAQMQGKFQLELLPAAGHTIQEDMPDRVGELIVSFWKRNQPLNIPVRRINPPS
ncbi:Protein phosphatase methylesterase 1 [Coemansia sp. RSA 1290]|nr:Protein phosphatase methylesterase 1 [Coemansia sp. RSA 1290]KAJ2652746.1 Protein phosphatase methylesterase 1 [Coemansia sp. RSA 1250]